MSFLLTCTGKDLRRRLADPIALVLWLAIPLLVGGLMTLVFGGGDGTPPRAVVLLVDEDDSSLSQLLGTVAGGAGDLLEIEPVGRDEGLARMDAGEATAMVVLPAGFGDAVLASTPTSIELVRNPAQVVLPGIVQTGLEMLVELLHYVQRFFAGPLAQILEAGTGQTFLPSADVAAISTAINDRLQQLGDWVIPPAIELAFVDTREPAGETTAGGMNIGTLFLPSMMFMAVLFIAQGMADDLWDEKEAGTLRRAVALPHALTGFVAAKLLTACAIMTAVGLVGLGVLVASGAVAPARVPPALVWLAFGGTAMYCFFLLLQFLAATRRGASVLGNVVLFPLMMIGGAFFPPEAMPDWMQAIGAWTPNGQALVQFKDLIAGRATLAGLGTAAAAIGLPAVVAFIAATRLVGGRFASRA